MSRHGLAVLLLCGVAVFLAGCGAAGSGVHVRVENLTVTPSTGPVMHVAVHNRSNRTFRGTVRVTPLDGWKLNRTRQGVTIPPEQALRVPFAIERGVDSPDNRYPVEVVVTGGDQRQARRQEIVCASAPYFKPTIDGKVDDWADAIPVTFTTAGRRTTIHTYWSRRRFSLLVAVEEDALKRMPADWDGQEVDAVQFAVSPRDAVTPRRGSGKARRCEFLLLPARQAARCLALVRPGDVLSRATSTALDGRDVPGAQVAVVREGGVTYYECAVPFQALPQIRPEPGREFCFSLLVHDPDGTGLRDWGEAAGLWDWQRNANAWFRWRGAQWPASPPFDNKIEWGFCSSKH